jgi:hypothetical protein
MAVLLIVKYAPSPAARVDFDQLSLVRFGVAITAEMSHLDGMG